MKIVLLFFVVVSLWAGPPMKSDDPFVPSYGEFEVNLAVEIEKKDNTLFHVPVIDLNYGIYENIQFTMEGAYVTSENENDFDALKLALKWNFYTGELFSIAISPQYKSYPIDSIFNEGETYELKIPINIYLTSKLNLIVDLTYVYPKESGEHIEYGTYLQYLSNKHRYYSELFFENAPHNEEVFYLLNLGYMYQLNDNIALMISIGKEMAAKEEPKATLAYGGLQFVF